MLIGDGARAHTRIPDTLAKYARSHPILLLTAAERQAIEATPSEDLRLLLRSTLRPAHSGIGVKGPWLGITGKLPPKPRTVVTAIRQGRNLTEKRAWLAHGPSVETTYGIALAAAVAHANDAELQIWIVDGEQANMALESASLDSALEFTIGQFLADYFHARYPWARIFRTSDPATRGPLYATATSHHFAKLFPRRVLAPHGEARATLWSQLDFLALIAMMILECPKGDVLGVFDHDQWRAAQMATELADGRYAALLHWPVPQLYWAWASMEQEPKRLLARIKNAPRRMFCTESIEGKLFAQDTEEILRARWESAGSPPPGNSAISEIAWYLTGDESFAADLEPAARLHQILHNTKPPAWTHKGQA
ncbi:MAG: hypothetical protein ACXWG9_14170 [Usitatibacter sp.]